MNAIIIKKLYSKKSTSSHWKRYIRSIITLDLKLLMQNEFPFWLTKSLGIAISSLGFGLISLSIFLDSLFYIYFGLLLSIVGLPLIKDFKLVSIKSEYLYSLYLKNRNKSSYLELDYQASFDEGRASSSRARLFR